MSASGWSDTVFLCFWSNLASNKQNVALEQHPNQGKKKKHSDARCSRLTKEGATEVPPCFCRPLAMQDSLCPEEKAFFFSLHRLIVVIAISPRGPKHQEHKLASGCSMKLTTLLLTHPHCTLFTLPLKHPPLLSLSPCVCLSAPS